MPGTSWAGAGKSPIGHRIDHGRRGAQSRRDDFHVADRLIVVVGTGQRKNGQQAAGRQAEQLAGVDVPILIVVARTARFAVGSAGGRAVSLKTKLFLSCPSIERRGETSTSGGGIFGVDARWISLRHKSAAGRDSSSTLLIVNVSRP